MNLFQKVDFTSHSGKQLDFKIECDALTDEDWKCIAHLISKRFEFCKVFGIPKGGMKLAGILGRFYRKKFSTRWLIVDDVLTTGNSMNEKREELMKGVGLNAFPVQGIVLFARGKCPDWIIPIFTLNGGF